jgi:MFS family permease
LGTLATYRRVLGNSALTRLLAGEFVSSIGDWLYLVALLVVVYQRSNSAALLGVVGAARVLPYILLSVPAGMLVDRFDRRMVLLVTDLARGTVMLGLAALVWFNASLVAIIALTLLAATFSTFFGPAIAAFLPSLARDESELGPANSAWASLDNLGFVIGPALAGVLIAVGGLTFAFLLNAVSFAVVAAVLWRLPSRGSLAASAASAANAASATADAGAEGSSAAKPAGMSLWPKLRELRRPLSGLAVINLVGGFVFGGLGVLTVVIAIDVLQQGEAATGYLNAAVGVGGLVGAIGSGVLVLRRRLGPPLVAGGLVLALGLVFLGSSGSLLPALLAMAVASAGDLVMEVVATTLFQRVVPDEIRGRAYGIMHTITVSAYAAGSLLMPIAAGVTSMVVVLAGAGIAMAAAVVIGVLLVGTAAIGTATLDPVRATLLRVPVFSGLPPTRLDLAAQRAEVRSVEPDEVVIRQGDAADRFYVIADGEFIVTQRQPNLTEPVELRRMHAGEVFGEIGLLSGVPRTATVSAAASGTLLSLDGPEFLELVGSGPGLTSQLLDLHRGPAAASAS